MELSDTATVDAILAAGVRSRTSPLRTTPRLMMSDQEALDIWNRTVADIEAAERVAGCSMPTARAELDRVRSDQWTGVERMLTDGPTIPQRVIG